MMKRFLFLLFLCFTKTAYCQVDTIIDCGFYKSYFDYESSQPLYVSYKLYKGGGNCSRDKFRFKNDTEIKMAIDKDYDKSGFDMGHLCNAADFAFDCEKDEKTFRFYNCLPQYPNLNRGIWKQWETRIRKESQTDSLLIMCGGTFTDKKIKNVSKVLVPDFCWKIVYSLSKSKVLWVIWFENKPKSSSQEITQEILFQKLNYKISLN